MSKQDDELSKYAIRAWVSDGGGKQHTEMVVQLKIAQRILADSLTWVTPTHIMGKPIDEVCGILSMLDMERVAEMQLTMSNLKKWQELLTEEQKRIFENYFKQRASEALGLTSKETSND